MNNYFGHIDYTQLKNPLDELKDYDESNILTAYVLFVEPTTKVTHLSLRNLNPVPPPSLNIGEIVKAQVKSLCCVFSLFFMFILYFRLY